jgi:hypothetical protein
MQVFLDAMSLFYVHDCSVRDVVDIYAQYQVREAKPRHDAHILGHFSFPIFIFDVTVPCMHVAYLFAV